MTTMIVDPMRVVASGEGLRCVPANQPAHFTVDTAAAGRLDLGLAVRIICK